MDAAVLSRRGGVEAALEALAPGGTLLVFADAGPMPAAAVYRRELTVFGSRSATPPHMDEAAALLPELELPEPPCSRSSASTRGSSSTGAARR